MHDGQTVTDPRGRSVSERPLALTAAGVGLIAVTYGLARFAYGLFVPAFREEFGLTSAMAGAIASGSYLAYIAGILASTAATVRFGGRAPAIAAGLAATFGTAIVAVSPNAGVLAIGILLGGSGTGIASPALAQAVAAAVPAPRRDRVQSIVNGGTGFGVMAAGPIAMFATDQWRAAWWVFAAICAAVTVAVWRAVPPAPAGGPGESAPPAGAGRRAAGAGALILAGVTLGIASAAVWTFGRDVLTAAGGMSADAAIWIWIVLGAFGVLGAAAGEAVRRLGLYGAWRSGMILLAAATSAFGLFPASVGGAAVAAASFGAGYIALSGVILIWGTRVYRERPSVGVGVGFFALAAGQATGAPAVGAIADRMGMTGAFLIAAGVALIGALIRPARSTPPRRPRPAAHRRNGREAPGPRGSQPQSDRGPARAPQRAPARRSMP